MQISLQIVLHGLIALVPSDASHPNQLTALLLDGRHPPAHECIAPHEPRLEFNAVRSAECHAAGCTSSGDLCMCDEKALAGTEILLDPAKATGQTVSTLNVRPHDPLPASDAEAIDFAYVPNMSEPPFGVKLNPAFLAVQPPPNLLARMNVPFNSVAACALWQREDEGQKFTFSLNSRKLKAAEEKSNFNQAVAQMVIATLNLDAGTKVVLHLRRFGSNKDSPIEVKMGDKGGRIDLTNDTTPLDRDDPCDDGVARHFALFYDLTIKPPPFADRLVPHIKMTHSKESPTLPTACQLHDFDFMNRPICPMATIPQ